MVATARAEATENPEASEALKEFASVRVQDAEVKGNKVLEKHGLSCPIKIEKIDLAENKKYKQWPYIKFSTWVKYLLDTDRLARQLCACDNIGSMTVKLEEFWERYEHLHPDHKIFAMKRAGEIDTRYLIPVFSHTDEGRTLKKQAFWLLSTHGAIGRGTRGYLKKKKDKVRLQRCGFGLNFCGHTMSTHFMFSCMHRKFFKHKPTVLDDLVRVYARDMEELFMTGVWNENQTINVRVAHLGTKGDLPALAKMGNMKHTFSHVPRAARSSKPCTGICWLCKAGQETNAAAGLQDIPFEDTSGSPAWEATMGQQDNWDQLPPILEGNALDPSQHHTFFKTDLWHNMHLGVAKHWVASSLVSLLENLPLPQTSMDAKIAWLGDEYRSYCSSKRLSPHVEELGRETLGWFQSSTCPVGAWNKGSASARFMMFLDHLCKAWSNEIRGNPLLEAIVPWKKCLRLFK